MKLLTQLKQFWALFRNPILKKAKARRVIFFYPGEEGTYLDHCQVTVFNNGVVDVMHESEHTMSHIQNCEILWSYQSSSQTKTSSPVRLIRTKQNLKPSLDERAPKKEDALESQEHPES